MKLILCIIRIKQLKKKGVHHVNQSEDFEELQTECE